MGDLQGLQVASLRTVSTAVNALPGRIVLNIMIKAGFLNRGAEIAFSRTLPYHRSFQ